MARCTMVHFLWKLPQHQPRCILYKARQTTFGKQPYTVGSYNSERGAKTPTASKYIDQLLEYTLIVPFNLAAHRHSSLTPPPPRVFSGGASTMPTCDFSLHQFKMLLYLQAQIRSCILLSHTYVPLVTQDKVVLVIASLRSSPCLCYTCHQTWAVHAQS